MREFQVRWSKFRSLENSGWICIRPLTVVIGANAAGKTSLIAPLLILKQTLESRHAALALKTQGELFNAGSLRNLLFSHRLDSELGLDIRFHFHEPGDRERPKKLKEIGHYAPGSIQLRFSPQKHDGSAVLTRFEIQDIYGRTMVTRTRTSKGGYSLRGALAPKGGTLFAQAARRADPEHFLFTPEGVFREHYRAKAKQRQLHTKNEGESEALKLEIDASTQIYLNMLAFISQYINNLTSEIAYIGPLRERPRRLYELSGERPANVGVRGESAPEIIFRQRRTRFLRDVNYWISKFDFGLEVACTELTEGAFNLTLHRTKSSPDVNLADTGFGVSQILPLIVQGCYGSPDSILIAEQPEIHLNPRLQTVLADLFVHIVKRGVGVLVETHSEHLLLRLRRLVAEKKIATKDIALYFAERQRDMSFIREVPIQPDGHIDRSDWPDGFFDESLREALALSAAQSEMNDD